METDVLRPGPVIGTGQRFLTMQSAALATRLSGFVSVSAALFRHLSRPDVDPARLSAQRARARHLASLIQEIEHADASHLYETSELIPRQLWKTVREDLRIPQDLGALLTKLLDQVDRGQFDHTVMAEQADTLKKLSLRLQDTGRSDLNEVLDEISTSERRAGV